jgi:hypothetical protein
VGLTPEEMREIHARYYWGEDLDDVLVKVEKDFQETYPDYPQLEPAADGSEFKFGPRWVKSYWTPEMDVEMQETEDLISELENLESSGEPESPETSWSLYRGRRLFESLGGPTLDDVLQELTAGMDGTGDQTNHSPPKDS